MLRCTLNLFVMVGLLAGHTLLVGDRCLEMDGLHTEIGLVREVSLVPIQNIHSVTCKYKSYISLF